jgi:hypothetical protein
MEERMRRGLSCTVLAWSLLAAPLARGADAPPVADAKTLTTQALAEAKAQVKQTYNDAQVRADLWTGMQLEAWAAQQKVTLRGAPMLGQSEVYGDPLFACPDEIKMMYDRGDAVEAVTLKRYHVFASDGRPLSCSVPFNQRADHSDFSFTRGFVGVFEWDTHEDAPSEWLGRVVATKGDGGFQVDNEEPAGWNYGPGDLKVADDGSAMAVPFQREANNESKVVVSTAKAKHVEFPGVFAPLGVGAGGAWLLANIWENDGWTPVLITGDNERTKLRAAAMGPGIGAAIAQDGGCYLIDRAGKRSPLILPIAIGAEPRMSSVGRWLVVASGGNAKSLPTTDFLGVEVANPPVQPESLALFRWDDLLADPKAPAVARFQNPMEVARQVAAGLYLWRGSEIDLLDLSGRQPVTKVFCTVPGDREVAWAWSRRFYTRVAYKTGGGAVLDEQGRELWSGDGDADVWGRDVGIVRNGKGQDSTWDLAHFALDPKARLNTRLDLGQPGPWEITYDPDRERWRAILGRQWAIGDKTGKSFASGNGRRSRNDTRIDFNALEWPPIGRYYSHYARIFVKGADEPAEAERLCPQDAWMLMGKMVFVLNRDGHLMLTGHKRAGQWSDLGLVDGGARFGFAGVKADELVVTNWDPRVVASFIQGPALKYETTQPLRQAAAPKDDAGPWRVTSDTQFVQPHGGTMDWSEDHAGFIGRLHSPKDSPYLLVVTPSLVLALEAGAAKLVGTPAKR